MESHSESTKRKDDPAGIPMVLGRNYDGIFLLKLRRTFTDRLHAVQLEEDPLIQRLLGNLNGGVISLE